MNGNIDAQRVAQIRSVLQSRDTEDLLVIWRANDEREWTPEAFEAMRIILQERLGEEPSRNESPSEGPARTQQSLEQAEHYLGRAELYLSRDELDQALAACDAALQLAPRLATAYNCRGLILDAMKQPIAAINAYREAVRLDPDFTEAIDNLRQAELEWAAGADTASTLLRGAESEIDDEDGRRCSECGALLSLSDKFCPACGAIVQEIEEAATGSTPPSKESWRVFTDLEVAFFAEATRLPEEYAGYLAASEADEMVIPARDPRVGDLRVRVLHSDILITIGTHTERRFRTAPEAVDFIQAVTAGEVVFHFEDGEVELYQADELDDSDKVDWSNYVWAGPLRNQQTGIDWYRPSAL